MNDNHQTDQTPEWMNDDQVAALNPEKLRFLRQLFHEGQGKNQKELMKFLLPMMAKAKREGLTFSPQEMNICIDAIKRRSTAEELARIDQLLEKAGQSPQS